MALFRWPPATLSSNTALPSSKLKYLNEAGQYNDVLEVLNKEMLPQMEHDPEIWNYLGVAYREVGKTEEAISSLEKALELRPDVGHPLYSLGLVYMDKGDKVKALNYFSRYKEGYYYSLSLKEKEMLDALIKKCKRKP